MVRGLAARLRGHAHRDRGRLRHRCRDRAEVDVVEVLLVRVEGQPDGLRARLERERDRDRREGRIGLRVRDGDGRLRGAVDRDVDLPAFAPAGNPEGGRIGARHRDGHRVLGPLAIPDVPDVRDAVRRLDIDTLGRPVGLAEVLGLDIVVRDALAADIVVLGLEPCREGDGPVRRLHAGGGRRRHGDVRGGRRRRRDAGIQRERVVVDVLLGDRQGAVDEPVAVRVGAGLREARVVGPRPVVAADPRAADDVPGIPLGARRHGPGVRLEGLADEDDVEVVVQLVVVDRPAARGVELNAVVDVLLDRVPGHGDAVREVRVQAALVLADRVVRDHAVGRAGREDQAVAVAGDRAARDRVPDRVAVDHGAGEPVARERGGLDPRVLGLVEIDAVIPVLHADVLDDDARGGRRGAVDVDAGRVLGVDTVDQVPGAVEDDVRGLDLDADQLVAVRNVILQDVRPGLGDHDLLPAVRHVRRSGRGRCHGKDDDEQHGTGHESVYVSVSSHRST